jgi:hypothetical protein
MNFQLWISGTNVKISDLFVHINDTRCLRAIEPSKKCGVADLIPIY